MTPLEKDIEKALGRMIGRHGGYCMKWVCPGWSGVPDRICLLPGGRVVFVELKRPEGGKIASLQLTWQRRLQSLGFRSLIVKSPEDIAELEKTITGGPET